MTGTVLILGPSGKIGTHASEAFWNAGWTVRRYERGTDMVAAAQGCDVIVNGLNPPNYHNWSETIPAITRQVIAAAKASGATVIIPGNVYNFGDTPGIWDEDTLQKPVAHKGHIRVQMEQSYRDAGVQTIVLRAGNFIDPNRDGDVFSMVMLRNMAKGKLTRMGGMEARQAYTYLPDWARAAEALACQRRELAKFEDVPFPGHAFTTTELKARLEDMLGRELRVSAFPWWIMTVLSPVWELARELREMRYLFETSHALGHAKFDRLLPGFVHSDPDVVIRAGLAPDVHPNQPMRTGGQAIAAE